MKPFTILVLALLVAAGTAFLVTTVRTDATPKQAVAQAAAPDALADLTNSIAALEKRQAETAKSMDELRMQIAAKEAPARVSLGDIDAAVARALAERGASAGGAAPLSANAAAKDAPKLSAKAVFDKLVDGSMSWEDAQAMWKQADQAGVMKEVMALFEEQAKQNPNDPRAHVELGKAYLQQVYKSGNSPESGIFATKADKEFDKALAIDDHDWSARFNKAVSLSFWPPMLGKQHEAIENFETLVTQQDGVVAQPIHAQTHLWLGNMYAQMGEKQKALAAWQKGLAIFPENAELKKQIAGAQAH